jgi:hypothetical protein
MCYYVLVIMPLMIVYLVGVTRIFNLFQNYMVMNLMRSQLLEGLKCESKLKTTVRSSGTIFDSQHFRGIEGRARALG